MNQKELIENMLKGSIAQNPQLQPIYEMYLQRQEQTVQEEMNLEKTLKVERAKTNKLKRIAKNLHELVKEQEDFLEELALALGACPECWGEDSECSRCKGDGKPGYFQPHRKLFDQYILPVIEKVPWVK